MQLVGPSSFFCIPLFTKFVNTPKMENQAHYTLAGGLWSYHFARC
jgi:hypothetical protein